MYAFGLRNPWRFSFDRANGDMWIGDVGQDSWEEIDHLRPGHPPASNFGWSYYEGTTLQGATRSTARRLVFPRRRSTRTRPPPAQPTARSPAATCTAAPALPSLRGYYLYADYCSGRIWRRRATGGRPALMRISSRKVTDIDSFGQGSGGGLYVISLDGSIYKLVSCPG